MIIETKFDIGQRVWRIGRYHEEGIKLPCRYCRGKNYVDAPGATERVRRVKCPECGGQGSRLIAAMPKWNMLGDTVIGKISVEILDLNAEGFNGGLNWFTRQDRVFYDDQGYVREERYMGSGRGNGFPSGSVFSAIEMFASEEEAQEEIDLLNVELAAGRGSWKPERQAYTAAVGFLEHRDVYEHDEAAVTAAKQIVAAYEWEPGRGADDES